MLEQFKELIKRYNLVEKAKDSFWINFNNYREEEKDEFKENFGDYKEEKLNVWLHSISYNIWPESDYEYIVVRMKMEYDNKTVGEFKACYSMSGEYEDDYFITY